MQEVASNNRISSAERIFALQTLGLSEKQAQDMVMAQYQAIAAPPTFSRKNNRKRSFARNEIAYWIQTEGGSGIEANSEQEALSYIKDELMNLADRGASRITIEVYED
jgi:hypothetical protein